MSELEADEPGLIEFLSRRCTELLLRLEQPSILDPLSPRDCVELWSSLGDLKHGIPQLDPQNETKRSVTVDTLQKRLSKLLATHLGSLLKCLDKGIVEALSRMEGAMRETENGLKKGRLGAFYNSLEFNTVLLAPRDQIGYAQFFIEDLGVNMPPNTLERLKVNDERLREILPAAIQEFRGGGDDPTPYPRSFPESFWWRRL